MPDINKNDIEIIKDAKINGEEILKVLKVVISEDQPDQYVLLTGQGEKMVVSEKELEKIRSG